MQRVPTLVLLAIPAALGRGASGMLRDVRVRPDAGTMNELAPRGTSGSLLSLPEAT